MKKIIITIAAIALAAMTVPAFAAMAPFWDVPASHWAYDAVAQLASRGLLYGYEPGDFRGSNPATRYEIAAMIARSIAFVDVNKADKEDVALMRRLLLEFGDELDILRVDMAALESRFGNLDSDLGGWMLSGMLTFDAKFGKRITTPGMNGKYEFNFSDFDIVISRRMNGITFYANIEMGDDGEVAWGEYYADMALSYGVSLRAGHFDVNWEDDAGVAGDDGSFFGDFSLNAFLLGKDWGMANMQLLIARRGEEIGEVKDPFNTLDPEGEGVYYDWESFLLGANLGLTATEQFRAGVMAYYEKSDLDVPDNTIDSLLTVGAYARLNFHPSVTLSGIYYHQKPNGPGIDADSTSAWRALLAIEQDLLKFTSLQFEYAQFDSAGFFDAPYSYLDLPLFRDTPVDGETYKAYGVWARQRWGGSNWDSWLRWYHADWDWAVDGGTANGYGIGIGYDYNPSVRFELAYSFVDYDSNKDPEICESNYVLQFTTNVTF